MSGQDDPEGGDLSGDLGAVVIAFLILAATILMTFVVYYVCWTPPDLDHVGVIHCRGLGLTGAQPFCGSPCGTLAAAEAAMVRLGVCVLSLTIVTGASAADTPSDPLFSGRSLRCEFGRGHMASWTRDTHELVIKEETFSDPPGPLIFDNIDLTEGTARFVGTVGASDVTVSVSQTGLWLIERTPADNFNMITVFATNMLAPEYPAVMSRHVIIGDEPVPSQYYGTCRVLLN